MSADAVMTADQIEPIEKAASAELESSHELLPSADDASTSTGVRHRKQLAHSASDSKKVDNTKRSDESSNQTNSSAYTPTDSANPAAPSVSSSNPSITHVSNNSSANSTSHICSNRDLCPLIAAYLATPVSERSTFELSENLYACSGCHSKAYCSLECQHVAWFEGHKDECKKLRDEFDKKHATPQENNSTHTKTETPTASSTPASHPPPHRNIQINFNVRFGPHTIIILILLIYVLYRFYNTSPQDVNIS